MSESPDAGVGKILGFLMGATVLVSRDGFLDDAGSRLVRLLGGRDGASGSDGRDWAERLADRLGAFDAIRLDAALQAARQRAAAAAPAASESASKEAASMTAAIGKLRSELEAGIGTTLPAPSFPVASHQGTATGPGADFGPWRMHCLEQQRRMETRIGALRVRVRRTLSTASPDLARLATLDEALEQTVGVRLDAALSAVPRALSVRFGELGRAHAGDIASGTPAWQATFAREVQAMLTAELDLRLEPVVGMIEAYGHEAGESR